MNLDGNENEMIVANNYVTAEQIADHRWSPITELPAIFFAKVGAAVMLNRKRLCRFPFLLDNNTMAYSLSPTKWDADFAKALFGTVDLTSLVQVGALPSYNAGDVESMGIYLPNLFEQEQIGAFFKLLDNLITLHQRKCANLCSPSQVVFSLLFVTSTFSWEQRKLTEFVEFFSGLTYTPNDVQENGTLVLRSSNVSNGEVVDADNIYVNPQVVNSENVKVGDIVVVVRNGSRSLIGKHAQIKAFMPNTVIGAFMTDIRSECPEFTNALLNTSRFEEEIAMNMGATINQITGYMFSKMEFKVPCLDEQKKIGEYFEKLDNLITLHQCKCQIDGCRFQSPLAITWEQRKVTEIGKIYIGLVTTMTKHYTDEGTLLIRNSDIKDGKFEFGDNPIYLEKTFAEKNETRMHQIGDVITVHTGDVGTSAVITENEAKSIGFATIVTRPNPKIIDSNYLCSFLNTDKHKKWAVSISTGDGRTNYNLGDYFELVVPVPSIAEQKKIASYIQKLNRLITLHQRKPNFYTGGYYAE